MSITMENLVEKYPDLPLTEFPLKEDTKKRMSDVNSVLMPVVKQYNTYFADGNLAACNDLLKNNPDVLDCFFNADKYNWTRDAIIAVQRYYLEDVVAFINLVAQNTVGINDEPTTEQASLVAYSAEKINALLETLSLKLSLQISDGDTNTLNTVKQVRTATLVVSGWSTTAPYEQTVTLDGVTSNDRPIISVYYGENPTAANIKAQGKSWGMVDRAVANDDSIVFYCYSKKPTVDFSVQIKGV